MAFCGKYMRLIILLVTVVGLKGQSCGNLISNGYTLPQGDIVLEYGSALNITCYLNKSILDEYGPSASSRLYFQRNNTTISAEMVKVNNDSSTLYIETHPKTKEDNYFCYFNGTKGKELICMNIVKVGIPPLPVTDFSCISRNCDNFTCTWTPPENYIKTDYSLTYKIFVRGSRKNKTKGTCPALPEKNDWAEYSCNNINTSPNGQKYCFWSLKTNPQYRSARECYYFNLTSSNIFGTDSTYIEFNHFKHVRPNPPENLTGVATSPHSINLTWTIPTSMVTFQPGLVHRILYQCQYYEKVWQFGGSTRTETNVKTATFTLNGLLYAHALCDIRVSMRSATADENDDSMWSQNATRTIRTESKIPDGPPNIIRGSFETTISNEGRTVFIYWQELKEEQYNGEGLFYRVELQNGSIQNDTVKSFFKIDGLSLSENVIDIWSVNVMGRSSEKSSLVIPAVPLNKPINVIKEHRNIPNSMYELSWQISPETEPLVTNYTVFWCHHDKERPYLCSGRLHWKVLPKHEKKFTKGIPLSGIYQFAVAANSWNNTSGMVWAECTVIPDKSLPKISNAWIKKTDSTSITVGWSLDCSNRISTIQEYIIYYCQMESPTQTECRAGTQKNVTIKGGVDVKEGVVGDLAPCASYSLRISYKLNNSVISEESSALRNTTGEAPPNPPRNLNVTKISNSSISLTWQSPVKNSNCYLKHYYIMYNGIVLNTTSTEITLMNLSSFTKYEIYVTACTTKCSEKSNVVHITTLQWLPGTIQNIIPNVINKTHIMIKWDKPNPPGGEINYYELKINDMKLINVTGQNYTIEGCGAENQEQFHVSVRAVNIIDTKKMEGPWSSDLTYPCTPYSSVVPIVICSSAIFLLVLLVFGIRKLYRFIKEGRNFVPKLPDGLEPWNPDKIKDIELSPPADAQHLLQKSSEPRLSGDSSGCSSGHESITSSLESTAHISQSDSGTEQPRSPSVAEVGRKHSLRQRNVSSPRPTTNIGYVTTDTLLLANSPSKPMTPSPGNYCVLGVDPSSTAKSEPPYLPIMDMNTKLSISSNLPEVSPTPYVMTGDLVKNPNPGYVSYNTPAPTEKNMGYVVAGLSKDLLTPNVLQSDAPKPVLSEENPHYVRASETIPTMKPMFHWPAPQVSVPKAGYVSVGDVPPPKSLTEVSKGYVPHRQYEGKSLKED